MKKKTLFTLLAAIFLVSTLAAVPFLGACARAPAGGEETLVIAGTPAFWIGARIDDSLLSDIITRGAPYNVKIIGGLGIGNERWAALQEGQAHMSRDISGFHGLYLMMQKTDPALADRFEYKALWPSHYTPMPLVVYKELPFDSLTEAIQKEYPLKIGAGRIGSVDTVDAIWKACGAEEGVWTVEKWGGKVDNTTGSTQIAPLLREGILNAEQCLHGTVDPFLEDVNTVKPLKVVAVADSEDELKWLKGVIINSGRYMMKAGHYTFVTEDTPIVGILRCYIASPQMSEEMAYNITKAVWEERKYIMAASEPLRGALNEGVLQMAQQMGIPFHPGAERYWKEAGVFK